MTAFRALLRTKALGKSRPANIANTIDRLLPEFTGNKHFVTVLYAVLEVPSGDLTYISCGHPPPLLLHVNGEVEKLNCHNPALGIFQNLHHGDEEINLAAGDILVLYTDGVTELMNQHDQFFGIQRLVRVIRENQQLTAAEIILKVIQATQVFSDDYSFLDDFTLVILRRDNI